MISVKINDNLLAIFTYINSYEYKITYSEFVQWCIDYEYYKELYQNWHIVRDLLDEHNISHPFKDDRKTIDEDDDDEF